jgi:phosphate transport system substrate-binding protein
MIRTKFMRSAAAIALVATLATVAAPAMAFAGTVKLAGSTSLQPLAQQWAVAYHASHPGTTISVAGGGSGAGFTSAAAGSVDIGMSSKTAADSDPAASLTPVARDAVGIIVNPKNPMRRVLTAAQVQAIFSGKIKTWKQLGVKSRGKFNAKSAIVLSGRTGASGTYDFFKTAFLGGVRQSPKTKMYASNGMVRSAVQRNQYAIGYVSTAFINKNVKGVNITIPGGSAAPNSANARSGRYPYVRFLYFVNYSAHPRSAEAQDFLNYCLSPAGQAIANKEYLSLH